MKQIQAKIISAHPQSFADFFNLHRDFKRERENRMLTVDKKVKIAVLTSFTAQGFEEILVVKCLALGIYPEIYIGDYSQYNQVILDESSGLYVFAPDIVFLFVDVRSLLGDYYFFPYSLDDGLRRRWVAGKIAELNVLIKKIKSKTSTKIVVHNFEVPSHSPLGIMENKQTFGFIESTEELNDSLRAAYKEDSSVFVFDFNAFASVLGQENLLDEKMYHLADLKIKLTVLPRLADAWLSYIKPLVLGARKCLVLDLDNTLWGGIVGEDGQAGIKIGPTPEGRPYLEFQKHLLALYERGVILAVNSKNNYDDAIGVLRAHPEMILREEHFASIQINWNDKAANLKAISHEINIGTDSLVFFDDDELNRDMVRRVLPEVLVVDVPRDPALYAKSLLELNDFNTLQYTEEDRQKGRIYAADRKRTEFAAMAGDVTDYLLGLGMRVLLDTKNEFNLPRIVQLAQKTNQFNLTTRRYFEEDIVRLQKDHLLVTVRVRDKFGDNGLVGLALVAQSSREWRIDSFLLSCRVIGRKIEDAMLAFIITQAHQAGALSLVGEYIPTAKNELTKDFYRNSGFTLAGEENGASVWQLAVNAAKDYPAFIKVTVI